MSPGIPPAECADFLAFGNKDDILAVLGHRSMVFLVPRECSFRQKWHFVIPRTTLGDESSTSHPKTPCGPQTKGGFCPLNGRKKDVSTLEIRPQVVAGY